VGKSTHDVNAPEGRSRMSESDLWFVIFRDVNDGYRWRLR